MTAFKHEIRMTNDESNSNIRMTEGKKRVVAVETAEKAPRALDGKKFDLDERTAVFGEDVIRFAKKIPVTAVTDRLIRQFVSAGTSIGANYTEANDAESKKDFRHKIGICRKESKETKYWLRMLAVAEPIVRDKAAILWQEAKELNLIFGSIRRSRDK
jgi:four helix bundle protein